MPGLVIRLLVQKHVQNRGHRKARQTSKRCGQYRIQVRDVLLHFFDVRLTRDRDATRHGTYATRGRGTGHTHTGELIASTQRHDPASASARRRLTAEHLVPRHRDGINRLLERQCRRVVDERDHRCKERLRKCIAGSIYARSLLHWIAQVMAYGTHVRLRLRLRTLNCDSHIVIRTIDVMTSTLTRIVLPRQHLEMLPWWPIVQK